MKLRALMWCALAWAAVLVPLSAGVVWYQQQPDTHGGCGGGVAKVVVKAAADLPRGTMVTRSMLVLEPVPEHFLPSYALEEKDLARVLGEPLTSEVRAGDMVKDMDFEAPFDRDRHELCGTIPSHLDGVPISARLMHADGASVEIERLVLINSPRIETPLDDASLDLIRLGGAMQSILCSNEGWTLELETIDP